MQTCKLLAVGDGAVGKTALLLSFTSNTHMNEYVPTVFDTYNAVTMFQDKPVSLAIFDSAGQEDYANLRPLSYPGTDCFLLCFSLTSQTSLSNVRSVWVPELKKHCPDTPIILIGTKMDLRNDQQHLQEMSQRGLECVTTQQGQMLSQEINAAAYVECSAITQENLKAVFDQALLAWAKRREELRKKRSSKDCCNVM